MMHKFFSLKNATASLVASLMIVAGASAQQVALQATHDPTQPNQFSVDFNDGVGNRNAQISTTSYDLQIDEQTGSARLVRYYQEVDSLELPGGFQTGPLTIEIVPGSSAGTYDASTGVFNTTESYSISFTEDLSALGFFSPFVLPASSTGTVTYDAGSGTGTINLVWQGNNVQVGPLVINYLCQVNTEFAAGLIGDFDSDDDVDLSDFASFQTCFGGPLNPPAAGCTNLNAADIDGDGDVDLSDFSAFSLNFTGNL